MVGCRGEGSGRMDKASLLALAASFCAATSSVCQRLGARQVPSSGFDPRLAVRPVWLAGVGAMIAGFGFQLAALHFGALALVQPILAVELLFVFGYMAVLHSRQLARRDWLAVVAMSAGLGLFLFAASPSGGGRTRRPGCGWWRGWPRRGRCWAQRCRRRAAQRRGEANNCHFPILGLTVTLRQQTRRPA